MALKSGQMAGLPVPAAVLKKAERWVNSCKAEDGGYGYLEPQTAATMTASGLLCKMFLGVPRRNPDLAKGIALLGKLSKGKEKDRYHQFWTAQVMYHFGGDAWREWNAGDQMMKGVRRIRSLPPRTGTAVGTRKATFCQRGRPCHDDFADPADAGSVHRHPPLFRRDKD